MTDVLIAGAGPTGLAMAAQAHAHGARVRIVEQRVRPQESRAFVVHPRTLEVLAPLGIAEALIARGETSGSVRLHAGGRVAAVPLTPAGVGDTAYPFLLAVPQAAVEEVLEQHLGDVGVEVEHGVRLASFAQRPDAVAGVLHGPDGSWQHVEVPYLVGCDGADSTVRREAGIGFPSRAYRPSLLLADLEIEGDLDPDAVHGYVGEPGILFLFPSPGASTWRLLTVRPDAGGPSAGRRAAPVDLAMLQAVADRFTGGTARLHGITWSTEVRLRRGQARRYRDGRVLLAGDAAHVHSPAGAQGMNTGIQDAANLGWKLALVATGRASEALLASYEAERWAVARRTRQLTDLAFLGEAAGLPPLGLLRRYAAPLLVPLLRGRSMPAPAFRVLGGLVTRYRRSPAVEEGHPPLRRGIRAGERLVDARVIDGGRARWLHESLRPPGFHLLLCGRHGDAQRRAADAVARRCDLPLHVHRIERDGAPDALGDPDGRLLRRLGVTDAAVYLVRPDGYVGFRSRGPGLDGASGYLRELTTVGGEGLEPPTSAV